LTNQSLASSETERAVNELVAVKGRQIAAGAAQALNTKQYLTFMLAGETFGIGILSIKEIIDYTGLTEVPMMPSSIPGSQTARRGGAGG
jgi:purine-binding chemotaxis protein CheW